MIYLIESLRCSLANESGIATEENALEDGLSFIGYPVSSLDECLPPLNLFMFLQFFPVSSLSVLLDVFVSIRYDIDADIC